MELGKDSWVVGSFKWEKTTLAGVYLHDNRKQIHRINAHNSSLKSQFKTMAPNHQHSCFLLAALIVLASAGTVTLSSGSSVSVPDPLTKSLSSSYSLSNGHTWNRDRPTTPELFAETFTHSVVSGCTIKCGPFSWPVISGGKLFCERDLSYFAKSQPNNSAFKALCIPDVMTSAGSSAVCNIVTYGIFSFSLGGTCNQASINANPLYSSSGSYDCCHNNNNAAQSYQVNEYCDNSATI